MADDFLHRSEPRLVPQAAASNPGEPDANGVYRVGGSVAPPARDDVPHFPPEAQAAGVKGAVVTEVVIDASGNVTDAKVVQSIPLLDEEALRVVRNWHFAPTMVNGQPVPVRMNLNVNFTLPPTPAPPTLNTTCHRTSTRLRKGHLRASIIATASPQTPSTTSRSEADRVACCARRWEDGAPAAS